MRNNTVEAWSVIDLFSGCGGLSYGFAARKPFKLVAAVDAQKGKPCSGKGTLDCNLTYEKNFGIQPFELDISILSPKDLAEMVAQRLSENGLKKLDVMLCAPPCTDFSRAKPSNHIIDFANNTLVEKCADFVEELMPEFVILENAREVIIGNHSYHYENFVKKLESLDYKVAGEVVMFTDYGLPQVRERSVVIASRISEVKKLGDLWEGFRLDPAAITVRHAIDKMSRRKLAAGECDPNDSSQVSPGFALDLSRRRIAAIPKNGGSWISLLEHPDAEELLIDSMKERIRKQDLGSHPDVYGRLWWDRPAVTIKRECAHLGNGRYAHPEQDRLLTVREMATLQGFPDDFVFPSKSVANRYRHIGDSVPPVISYQLSALVQWMKTGVRPSPEEWVLPKCSLKVKDISPL